MLLHRLSDEVFKCNPELLEYLPSIDSVDIDLPLLTIFNTYSEQLTKSPIKEVKEPVQHEDEEKGVDTFMRLLGPKQDIEIAPIPDDVSPERLENFLLEDSFDTQQLLGIVVI